MATFGDLKRRTTVLLQSVRQSVPAMPAMPKLPDVSTLSIDSLAGGRTGSLPGSWEPVLDVPIARSSHTIDVVQGRAYIFGGELRPREPVDSRMLVVTLPSGAGSTADYYAVDPVAAPAADAAPDVPEITTVDIDADRGWGTDSSRGLKIQLSQPADPLSPPDHRSGKGKGKGKDSTAGLGNLPEPRVGHASAVIGRRIFIFGGRGGPDMVPLMEAGRVWVFDTRPQTWTYLDPAPPRSDRAQHTNALYPEPRSYHSAASLEQPRAPDASPSRAGTRSWTEWAVGDSADVGIPQAPIIGHIATYATDEDADGYGTLLIHGGCLAQGRTNDVWAFDVRSRLWTELPAAPGPARSGAAVCMSGLRLYCFGGFDGQGELGGRLDFLDLDITAYDDGATRGELPVVARTSWQTLAPHGPILSPAAATADDADRVGAKLEEGAADPWPGARSLAGLVAVSVGGGRDYLVLLMGEQQPSARGHADAGRFWDDIWVFRVPATTGASAARVSDALWSAVGLRSARPEASWVPVDARPYHDDEDEDDGDDTEHEHDRGRIRHRARDRQPRRQRRPCARAWMATAPAPDVEGGAVVMWGGLSQDNQCLPDGWLLRLD